MKRNLSVFISLFLGINTLFAQSVVDTIYYDEDGYGVDHPSFATYYRIALQSNNTNKPNRYRDYLLDGTLISEGCFISIDKYDDSLSVFEGQCFDYLDNKVEYFYQNGLVTKYSEYDSNDVVRYKIEMTNGYQDRLECFFDKNGKLTQSTCYENGVKMQEVFNGQTYQFKTYNNTSVLNVSTCPQRKFVTTEYLDYNTYSVRFKGSATSSPQLNNCQQISLYNGGEKDLKIGIKNIYAVHCGIDNLFIFPMNIAFDVYNFAKYNMRRELQYLAKQVKEQAHSGATTISETSTRVNTGTYTHYNDGKYGNSSIFNSKEHLASYTQGNTSSTTKTLDKKLYYELLEKGEEEYKIAAQTIQEEFERFQVFLVDTIYLPAGENTSKLIGFSTYFNAIYCGNVPLLKKTVDSLLVSSQKILLTYDIVDLEMDTIILSINELYETMPNDKIIGTEGYKYLFLNGGSSLVNEFVQSDLLYSDWGDFRPSAKKVTKLKDKKNPEEAKRRKERHMERMKVLREQLKEAISVKQTQDMTKI